MKNLKITKTLAALVLMGTIALTGCSKQCKIKEEHYHIYSSNDKFLYSQEESKDDYEKRDEYLVDNEVNKKLVKEGKFPLSSVIDVVEDKVNSMDMYVEAQYAEAFIDEDGKVDFNTYWRFLSNEELKSHDGIVRVGESINYIVYNLDGERFEVDNLRELEGDYFVDMNEFMCIKDPVEMSCFRKKAYTRN